MAKKKEIKQIFESASIESADTHPDSKDSVSAQQEGEETPSATDPREVSETPSGDEGSATEMSFSSDETEGEITQSDPTNLPNELNSNDEVNDPAKEDKDLSAERSQELLTAQDESAEDALDEIRRSLIEEESDKSQKESKWWRRLGKKRKTPEEPPESVEIDLPAMPISGDLRVNQSQTQATETHDDELDNLIDMLAEGEAAPVEASVLPEPEVPPEPEIDFEKLKEQVFQPRTAEEETEPLPDVRSIALEDGEEVFVEVQPQVVNPVEERLSAFENALRPYRWYINIALAVFGVVVIVMVSLIMFNVYQRSRPQPTQVASNLPYPTSVSLPGGWAFQLGRGSLQNGKWDPQGAEWLEGTEVCRWVALPWSLQLEAVVRTLNPKDPIELVMSNNDKLVYGVSSIQQLTLPQMQALDSNSPCLLIILTQPDAEQRWVVTALP